jgi:hypothetical protein
MMAFRRLGLTSKSRRRITSSDPRASILGRSPQITGRDSGSFPEFKGVW